MGMMVGWLRGPGSSGDDQASRGKGVAMVRGSMRLAMVVAGPALSNHRPGAKLKTMGPLIQLL